jgi:hypothetical protein
VVKELVSKANGLCPREFKSRPCRFFWLCNLVVVYARTPIKSAVRQSVRVVKELVLTANGLCPREFKSRLCRFFGSKASKMNKNQKNDTAEI